MEHIIPIGVMIVVILSQVIFRHDNWPSLGDIFASIFMLSVSAVLTSFTIIFIKNLVKLERGNYWNVIFYVLLFGSVQSLGGMIFYNRSNDWIASQAFWSYYLLFLTLSFIVLVTMFIVITNVSIVSYGVISFITAVTFAPIFDALVEAQPQTIGVVFSIIFILLAGIIYAFMRIKKLK